MEGPRHAKLIKELRTPLSPANQPRMKYQGLDGAKLSELRRQVSLSNDGEMLQCLAMATETDSGTGRQPSKQALITALEARIESLRSSSAADPVVIARLRMLLKHYQRPRKKRIEH